MGYLMCEKCGGYYQLQPGEHPEDFDRCDCGGKLIYERHMIEDNASSPESRFKLPLTTKNLKTLVAGAFLALIFLFKFMPTLFGLFFAFAPSQYFFQYGIYLLPVLIIFSIIGSRILGLRR